MSSCGHSATLDDPANAGSLPFSGSRRPTIGIPVPSRLDPEQIEACERFSLAVWGVGMFDYTPTHDGKHGYGCNACLETLRARDAELERVRSIQQPWESLRAA